MKRRSRTRRVLKWVGVVACVTIAAAWVALPWRRIAVFGLPTLYIVPEFKRPYPVVSIFHIDGYQYRFGCVQYLVFEGIAVPYWLVFLPAILFTAILWRGDRRPPRGHCQECGYNLTGNVTGVCPECGVAI